MDARKGNIFEILNGNKQFLIPVYQRYYSWDTDQCRRLWNDIVDMQKKNRVGHFVGSIVNIAEQAMPTGVQKYMIIDGQQRMTTLTLLLIALRDYAHEKDIEIIGDIPIFVALDSADVWSNKKLFQLDTKGYPTSVAGVPPDYFSATGQLWGNPLYDWDYHKATGYKWWIDRIRRQLTLTDFLRIDHFRGFEAYWAVPADEETAINGKWVKGPCEDLFLAIEKALGENLPIFAEDLGIITPEVEHLRDSLGFPGMKVLQFGFGDLNDIDYIPHFYTNPNCICYTGTHDNDTTMGWYATQPEVIRDRIRRYGNTDGNMVSLDFIRFCMSSIAKYAIFPIQDLLLLGSEARMNTPGVAAANWAFRYVKEDLTEDRSRWLLKTTKLFGRCALSPEDYTL